MVQQAFDLSEEYEVPVIVRMTTRVCHVKALVTFTGERWERPTAGFQKNPQRWVMTPANAKPRLPLMHERDRRVRQVAETSDLNEVFKGSDRRIGFITSGPAFMHVRETFPNAPLLKLGFSHPAPLDQIRAFAGTVDTLVVVEETEPLLETEIRAAGLDVHGKDLLPRFGELAPSVLRPALNTLLGEPWEVPTRPQASVRWVFAVDRPLLRQGRFDGGIYLLVESAYIARELGKLELSDQDVVSLIHPDGHYLGRSEGNEASMGEQVPADRPFRVQPALSHGTYRVAGSADHVPRTYGWHRLADSGLVVSIGLADESVLAPLAPALRRNLLVTGVLSLLLLGFGGVIVRDQLRMARGQRALARSEAGLEEAQQLSGLGSWECDLATGRLHWSDEAVPSSQRPGQRQALVFSGLWAMLGTQDLA